MLLIRNCESGGWVTCRQCDCNCVTVSLRGLLVESKGARSTGQAIKASTDLNRAYDEQKVVIVT